MFNPSFILRIKADKPARLDALILFARCGHCKIRWSQLQRIILEQAAEAKKRKGKV